MRLSTLDAVVNADLGDHAGRPRCARWALLAGVGVAAVFFASLLVIRGDDGGADTKTPLQGLRAIAQAAMNGSVSEREPKPDEFLYLNVSPIGAQRSEFWLSMDGMHDGRMLRPDIGAGQIPLPACRNGKRHVVRGDVETSESETCTPDAVNTVFSKGEFTNAPPTSKDVQELLEFSYIDSEQRGRLILAASQTPGLRVDMNASDRLGREGIGLTWPDQDAADTLIVDPRTLELLAAGNEVIVRKAIVASTTQRP